MRIVKTTIYPILKIFFEGIDGYRRSININQSPFNNCQTFTIGRAFTLKYISKKDMNDMLYKLLHSYIGKTQLIIDVKQIYINDMRRVFKPFIKRIRVIKYNSTNNSKMALCKIILDSSKIKKNDIKKRKEK